MLFKDEGIGKWVIPTVVVHIMGMVVSCSTTGKKAAESAPGGQVAVYSEQENQILMSELGQVFNEKIEGMGVIENQDEDSVRQAAINLAINNLVFQIQTRARSVKAIYDREDVRGIFETQGRFLVSNYRIESGGYDSPTTYRYLVKISIWGPEITQQIGKMIKK